MDISAVNKQQVGCQAAIAGSYGAMMSRYLLQD
jgi:hypothetical protein